MRCFKNEKIVLGIYVITLLSSDDDEVTSEFKPLTMDEEVKSIELKKEEGAKPQVVVNKGIKRKLEENDAKVKKENSKSAYLRRVQAYKRSWKE